MNLKKLPKLDQQNKKYNCRYAKLIEKDCNNIAAQQIDKQEKLLIKMDKNFNDVLTIILDMYNIYIKYLNNINNVNK